MVAKRTIYSCEICEHDFNDESGARDCESKGPPKMYSVGLIFGMPQDDSCHHNHNLTFAVMGNVPHGHYSGLTLWACRDNGSGDTLGKDRCGGGHSEPYGIPDPTHPTFKRMVDALQKAGFPVSVWNGLEGIPLADFLKWWADYIELKSDHNCKSVL